MSDKAIAYIILFESLALVSALSISEYKVLVYYLIHTVPSAIATYIAYLGLPERKKDKRSLTLFFLTSFYLGTIGIVIVLFKAYFLTRVSKTHTLYKYELIDLNPLLDIKPVKIPKWGEGKVKKLVSTENVNIEEKLLALKILVSNIESLPFVHRFLSEPDDSRLYAYSFLRSLENVYHDRINSLEQKLKENEDPDILIKLAQTYYDFANSGLVTPELKDFYIKMAQNAAEKAYAKLGNREDVVLILGKIYKALKDVEKASKMLYEVYERNPNFDNALELCETFFVLKKYSEIREVFKKLVDKVPYTKNYPIIKVWIDEKS